MSEYRHSKLDSSMRKCLLMTPIIMVGRLNYNKILAECQKKTLLTNGSVNSLHKAA